MDIFLGIIGESQLPNNTSHDLVWIGTFEFGCVLCAVKVGCWCQRRLFGAFLKK